MTGQERRRDARHEREDLTLSLQQQGRDVVDADLMIRDISRGGMGIHTSGKVAVGDIIDFRLDLPSGPVLGSGAVRWVDAHHLGYRCGLEFRRMGILDGWRLRASLEPHGMALSAMAGTDRLLAFATCAVILLVALKVLGLEIASPGEIFACLGF